MRYALIGCGRVAVNHVIAARNNRLDFVAMCDKVPEAMDNLMIKRGFDEETTVKKYTDYKEMIDKEKPELVSIATEICSHAEIALYCIDRGINVIIEKPMTMSVSDAQKIIDLAEERGVKVAACHQNRFNIAVQKLRQAVDEHRFGKISHGSVNVRWSRGKNYYNQASWRGTWAQEGGALLNQCIHGIDLLCWMMDEDIVEVYGQTRQQLHDYLEIEDVGMAVVSFGNGAIGTIEGTTNVYPENLEESLYIFGEKGTVKLGGKSANTIDIWHFADVREADEDIHGLQEPASNVYGNGHTRLFADMIDAIQNDRKPYVDAVAGKKAVEVVLAIYKSAAEGKPVRLPLGDCAATDFADSFVKK
ncbi:MAG: Gfo/Idh/MocA family oxidoreductase [Anaerovibrio sp.]|uniref:Gfo/Idh/MocA family protein n=1 Tax=Anaerovibrio sp. TaxID=1872532 RepID=UPI0025CBF85B|nr:Gfo/Idh/MocA family oxidoreductase [Anaerovibrio sp.]MCR5176503.1 Gfo/Idh/MocA family oxidoreductase [Anaerovibrio sp.]